MAIPMAFYFSRKIPFTTKILLAELSLYPEHYNVYNLIYNQTFFKYLFKIIRLKIISIPHIIKVNIS